MGIIGLQNLAILIIERNKVTINMKRAYIHSSVYQSKYCYFPVFNNV